MFDTLVKPVLFNISTGNFWSVAEILDIKKLDYNENAGLNMFYINTVSVNKG